MEDNSSEDFSIWNFNSVVNYLKDKHIQILLFLLVFVIIYVVDHISNINAMIFAMPSVVPGVPSSQNHPKNSNLFKPGKPDKKVKGKK